MLRVMRKHRAAADEIDAELVPEGMLTAAKHAWDEAIGLGELHGYRNAQASVLAPTGTIGLMMDCDTTGIEPELALVKTKKLVGGGTMQFVNQTVPRALDKPRLLPRRRSRTSWPTSPSTTRWWTPRTSASEHYSVFDTAMGARADPLHGPRAHDGRGPAVHLRRHLQDREHARGGDGRGGRAALRRVVEARAEGGRDLPRQLQGGAAAVGRQEEGRFAATEEPSERAHPVRKRLPMSRPSKTTSFQVGDAEGYIIAGNYPDDGLGEIFLKTSKQGSTLSGVMDAFSIAISIGLQYGVPLETYVSKFINMKFEPSGMTNDPDIRFASSLLDYVFRRLALDNLPTETREGLGIRSISERTELAQLEAGAKAEPEAPSRRPRVRRQNDGHPRLIDVAERAGAKTSDAPLCYSCGSKMQPAGSCYVCSSCGSTSGCS